MGLILGLGKSEKSARQRKLLTKPVFELPCNLTI